MLKRILLCLLCCLVLTSCSNDIHKEVELFNRRTESTITLYEAITDKVKGRESEIVSGIANGDISEDFISANFDYSEESKLLNALANHLISDEPMIQKSNFYTSLGANSVTQILVFDFRGTGYLAEILWATDLKIDMLNLEVLD